MKYTLCIGLMVNYLHIKNEKSHLIIITFKIPLNKKSIYKHHLKVNY